MQHEARSTADTDLIGILDLHAAQIAPSLPDEVHSVKQGHACSVCTDLERSPERIPSQRYKTPQEGPSKGLGLVLHASRHRMRPA